MSLEREIKLEVPAGSQLADLGAAVAGLSVVAAGEVHLDATYFDTGDLRLLAAGVTLRHRSGEGEPRWTLKLPEGSTPTAGGELRRHELDVLGAEEGGPPAELIDRVAELTAGSPVAAVARLRTRRRRYHLVDGHPVEDGVPAAPAPVAPPGRPVVEGGIRTSAAVLAELDDDEVEGQRLPGGAVVRFRELEVEAASTAPEGVLARVAGALLAAGAVAADPTPKLARVLGGRP